MKAVNHNERRAGYLLFLGFAILSLGMVVNGAFHHRPAADARLAP